MVPAKKPSVSGTAPLDLSTLTPKQLEDRQQIVDILAKTNGNKTAGAKLLGISRVTMWKKAKKYGIG